MSTEYKQKLEILCKNIQDTARKILNEDFSDYRVSVYLTTNLEIVYTVSVNITADLDGLSVNLPENLFIGFDDYDGFMNFILKIRDGVMGKE